MKKIFAKIFCCALCLSMLTLAVAAHPGKTDSNGGHYNHSSGEYHYHHGYPAHDHYDMDGDGDIDCPYEFDDKTNHDYKPSGSNVAYEKEPSRLSFGDILRIALKIAGISVLVLLLSCPFILPMLYMLLMIPIEKMVNKYCREENRKSVTDKASKILIAVLIAVIVAVVSIVIIQSEIS